MKKISIIFILFPIILLLILYFVKNNYLTSDISESTESASINTETESVKIPDTKLVSTSDKDYIISVVFSEMPASYPEEALKAMALIVQTELIEKRFNGESTENLHDNILDKEKLESLYDVYFDECYDKISAAADYAYGKCICYEGTPIRPYYHAESSGKTDSSLSLCDTYIPYLTGIDSNADTYYEEKIFTPSEISARLYAYYGDENLKDLKLSDVKINESTDTKAVKTVIIGDKEISGFDFGKIFSLSSVCFELENDNNNLKIISYGIGNNLGLSENGAKVMAQEGYTCEEIIKYYFSGVTTEEFT